MLLVKILNKMFHMSRAVLWQWRNISQAVIALNHVVSMQHVWKLIFSTTINGKIGHRQTNKHTKRFVIFDGKKSLLFLHPNATIDLLPIFCIFLIQSQNSMALSKLMSFVWICLISFVFVHKYHPVYIYICIFTYGCCLNNLNLII